MDLVLTLLIGTGLVVALSAGLGLGLHLLAPGWSLRKRAIAAAAIASGLPMSIAFVGVLSEAGSLLEEDGSGLMLALLALTLTTIFLAAVFCLPASWWVSRKLAGDGAPQAIEDHSDEADLLPAAN